MGPSSAEVVFDGPQEIPMTTMLIILLLWLLPALVLAPVLAWIGLKPSPSQTAIAVDRVSQPPETAL